MTIYVDGLVAHPPPKDAQTRRAGAPHGHRWCHLLCDPGEEEQLHAMARNIGLKREWFQEPKRLADLPHYDLTPPRRTVAVVLGAVELDRYGAVENPLSLRAFFARWKENRLCDAGDRRPRLFPDRYCRECIEAAGAQSLRFGGLTP